MASNPERTLALMHKQNKPDDERSLDQLEVYYRSLSMGSPFSPLVHAYKEADARLDVGFEAQLAINRAQAK